MERMDDNIGYYDSTSDSCYMTDDYGNLVLMPWSIQYWFQYTEWK